MYVFLFPLLLVLLFTELSSSSSNRRSWRSTSHSVVVVVAGIALLEVSVFFRWRKVLYWVEIILGLEIISEGSWGRRCVSVAERWGWRRRMS